MAENTAQIHAERTLKHSLATVALSAALVVALVAGVAVFDGNKGNNHHVVAGTSVASAKALPTANRSVATAKLPVVELVSFTGAWDCYSLAKNLVAQAGGNFYAGFQAARNVSGCGGFLSWGICWTSHQWWGSGARWLIGWITNGRYATC